MLYQRLWRSRLMYFYYLYQVFGCPRWNNDSQRFSLSMLIYLPPLEVDVSYSGCRISITYWSSFWFLLLLFCLCVCFVYFIYLFNFFYCCLFSYSLFSIYTNSFCSGVCDPWNSTQCHTKNTWVNCDVGDFKCDAVNETGMSFLLPSVM